MQPSRGSLPTQLPWKAQLAHFLNKRLVPDESIPEAIPSLRSSAQASTGASGRLPVEILMYIEAIMRAQTTITKKEDVAAVAEAEFAGWENKSPGPLRPEI